MRVKKILFIFLLFVFYFFSRAEISAQSFDRNSVFKCARVFGDSVTFLNDFVINKQKRKNQEAPNGKEWDIYLMKGTVYRFALCSDKKATVVLRLYDDTVSEDAPYGMLSQKTKTKFFDYVCKKSGVYKVSIRYKDNSLLNKDLSAIAILGFVKKIKL